ncbi:hypothetical protein KGP20_25330 (plasmid) [Enterobacter asburiae]|nr:hypothetical protein KGP20_25330 [Enterobacter asburiae]UAN34342.1 hypothetical protein KGP22_23905 [Enterobacter sp. JBIWA005]
MLLIFVVPILLYIGYELFLTRKLSPPADSDRIIVSFRVPEGVTLLPLGGLYTSSECTNTNFTAGGNTYQADATTGVSLSFVSQGDGNLMSASIAKDGGGRCRWKLSALQVGFRVSDVNSLAKGKEVSDTHYDFDLLGNGNCGGVFGVKQVSVVGGDLDIKTIFFPIIYIRHIPRNRTTVELFGGDTGYEKWSRCYRLSDTKNISINPVVHLSKIVTLEEPNNLHGDFTVTYPDGSRGIPLNIYPDYEKLLSIK